MVLDDIVLEFTNIDDAVAELDKIDKHYGLGKKPTLTGGSQKDGSIKWNLTIHAPVEEDRKFYTIQRYVAIATDYERVRRAYSKALKR